MTEYTQDKISQKELKEMFGDTIPMEAVQLVWGASDDETIGEVRAKLRKFAAEHFRTEIASSPRQTS